jgi:predicted alpha/beta hydrolase family esterase
MWNAILIPWMPSKEEYYSEKEPSCSHAHWFPRLQKQLIIGDIYTVTLEVPLSYEPNYITWKKEFERFDINEETLLIGHSCGAWFLLHWLSENKEIVVWKIILVAPWLDPFDELDDNTFFKFEVDWQLLQKRDIQIFHSTNDIESVQVSMRNILDMYHDFPVKYFENYGHFCEKDLKSKEFPELFEEILKITP